MGGSLIITIPPDIAGLFNIEAGDHMEFIPIGMDEIRLRKAPGGFGE